MRTFAVKVLVLFNHSLAKSRQKSPSWPSDYPTGSSCLPLIATSDDNPQPSNKYGYACCATNRTSLACPAGSTAVGGVCMAKVVNSSVAFTTAANACGSIGAHVCSISQTAVLRAAGQVTSACSWTASHSDNDSQYAKIAIGSCSDDPSDGEGMGYACCF